MRQPIKTAPLVAAIACGLLYCTAAVAGGPGHDGMFKDGMFKSMDTNNDGRISTAEHDAHSRTMFTSADANKDGSVTAAEMHAMMQMHRGGPGGHDGHDGMGMRHDGPDRMRMADTDRDGRISRAEFIAAHDGDASKFAAHDSNNDGFISTDEMKHHKMGMGKGKKGEDGCACCDKMKKAG